MGEPGSTSSLPVEMMTTRGRGRTTTRSRPTAASRPSCPGPSRVPASSTVCPVLTSSPWRRTALPGFGVWVMVTLAMPPSVHSSGTTASAPGGTGAPVMIRTDMPGCTV